MREHMLALIQDRMVECFLLTADHPDFNNVEFMAAFDINSPEDMAELLRHGERAGSNIGLGFLDHLAFRTMVIFMMDIADKNRPDIVLINAVRTHWRRHNG